MSFQVGSTIGDYEFLDVVNSSKSDITFRVRNVHAHRVEALKVLHKSREDDQEFVARFMRQMKVHARLQHPNIVGFHDALELGGHLVMTTEIVEGPTLAQRLDLGPLPWRKALEIFSQVLQALAFAHQQNIVHRNLAPESVILQPDGTVKLAGFVLAKQAGDQQLTQVGTALGPLKYMSQEQVKGLPSVDARSDLYSAGCVLYEALTGRPPFDYKSEFEVMLAQVNEAPIPPSTFSPEVPAELDGVILRALSKEPSQRFQNSVEFLDAVDRVRTSIEPALRAFWEEAGQPLPSAEQPLPSPVAVPAGFAAAEPVPPRSRPSVPELVLAGVLTFTGTVLLVLGLITVNRL